MAISIQPITQQQQGVEKNQNAKAALQSLCISSFDLIQHRLPILSFSIHQLQPKIDIFNFTKLYYQEIEFVGEPFYILVEVMCPFHQFLINAYKKLEKQIQFGHMLPDNLPVFNIQLDCDFESSDNIYPSYSELKSAAKTNQDNGTTFLQEQNLTCFCTIGRRNDNLDRCFWIKTENFQLLALLDGHCDPQPIQYLQLHLLSRLAQHPQVRTNPQAALIEVFQQMQGQVIKLFQKGSTAMVALIFQETIVMANLGDSKLFGVDKARKVHELNEVHNLGNKKQLIQVINRGGIVLRKGEQYRINGQLNLSRSFGDRHLKHCMSSKPDIYKFHRKQYSRWVMASDGFYNAKNLQKRLNLSNIADLKQDGTIYLDNASAIFIDF